MYVIKRLSEARKADLVHQKPVQVVLEEMAQLRAENDRLRMKINRLLAQVSEAAFQGSDSDEEERELRERINEHTINL